MNAQSKCCTCKQEVGSNYQVVHAEDPYSGQLEQIRCSGCNSLKSRTNRILKADPHASLGYRNLTDEERKVYKEKAVNLFGSELKKFLEETISQSRMRRLGERGLRHPSPLPGGS